MPIFPRQDGPTAKAAVEIFCHTISDTEMEDYHLDTRLRLARQARSPSIFRCQTKICLSLPNYQRGKLSPCDPNDAFLSSGQSWILPPSGLLDRWLVTPGKNGNP